MQIVHPACGRSWTGLGRAHCSACHETFNTAGLFDQHRRGYGERGSCKAPSAMRLNGRALQLLDGVTGPDGQVTGVWYGPERPEALNRAA